MAVVEEQIQQSTFAAIKQLVVKRLAVSSLFIALLALVLIASLISDSFLNPFNVVNVLRQVALYGIVSVGITFVILTAGIDLSVGSIVGVVSVLTAMMLNAGFGVPGAVAGALVIGAFFGAINGIGVAFARIPPFIMTLGMMVILRGLALTFADGSPVNLNTPEGLFSWIGQGSALGLPVPVWIFALVCVLAAFALRLTGFGRNVYAVGSNEEAARLSGINVSMVRLLVYVISGVLAALTAVVFVSRLTVGQPTAGTGLELEAIAIAVIGGTSLFGGVGGVVGTIIGAAILAVLANIMNLVGISPFTQQIVKGAIIIIAVSFEVVRRRR